MSTRPRARALRAVDGVLIALGCDPAFVSDVLGDLSEEYAQRSAQDGIVQATWWYASEIARSIPHILWSAIRNGSPAARMRLAAYTLAGIVTLSLVTIAWVTRDGPPARLLADAAYSDGVVVNNIRPVQLSMGVFDAAGHRLTRTGVQYRQISGLRIPVSDGGVVKCTQRGDVVVRASIGALNKDFVVHCEPIKKILRVGWDNFVVGDSPRPLAVDAIGIDGEPVTAIAAKLRVEDSTVATIEGAVMRPLRAGFTGVEISIGDNSFGVGVTVFERVATFEGLRPDQRWVVAPIHLTRDEFVRWPLPVGDFFLAFGADSTELPTTRGFWGERYMPSRISMSVDGPVMCMPEPRLQPGLLNTHCLVRGPGATLTLAHPGRGAPDDVVGLIALERWNHR